ncbi:MAG TPA: hypothetical protein EYG93_01060 [Sulfurospirillum arcachonense]|nr:hypothetical protein [Sulfurospirillum arcachonense]
MKELDFSLATTQEIIEELAAKAKHKRKKNMAHYGNQKEFAEHIGMSFRSYQEFEISGKITLAKFIDVLRGLDALEESQQLLEMRDEELFKKSKAKIEFNNNTLVTREAKVLSEYFKNGVSREFSIYSALKDGYTQVKIAKYLNLSSVAISKILKIYRQKIALFDKLRDKGIFWSYSKDIKYNSNTENLMMEYLLKYGDFDDIVLGFKIFGKRVMKRVWEDKLKGDKQFIKLNLMLARVFFGMDIESSYFKEIKNERFEKLKLFAS